LTEKLLLIAAGAAVGAVGYMAIKHPDELKEFAQDVADLGQDFIEKTMTTVTEQMTKTEEA
jgi:hypothetical protein